MTNTALITGASGGIGREFARYHAAKGGDLIITARRGDALKAELDAAHGVSSQRPGRTCLRLTTPRRFTPPSTAHASTC